MSRGDRGLTLLELVAATAIFALVALMAVQALTGGLIQRRAIERTDAEGAALTRALALIRQDLEAAVPLPHLPAAGPAEAPLERPASGGFALSRAGLAAAPGGAGDGLARVRWRLDPGGALLMRQVLPLTGTLRPAPESHAVLDGVTGLRLTPVGDWPEAPEGLPPGLEVELDTRRWGTLRVLVAR